MAPLDSRFSPNQLKFQNPKNQFHLQEQNTKHLLASILANKDIQISNLMMMSQHENLKFFSQKRLAVPSLSIKQEMLARFTNSARDGATMEPTLLIVAHIPNTALRVAVGNISEVYKQISPNDADTKNLPATAITNSMYVGSKFQLRLV